MPDGMSPEKPQGAYGSADNLWQEQEANIPESVKALRNVVNLQEEDDDRRKKELESAYANERLDYGHQNALRDRDMWRLNHALTPQELAPCLKPLRSLEDWSTTESVNSYQFQNMIGQAFDNHVSLSLTFAELVEEGNVVGKIDENGYIVEGGHLTEIGLSNVVKINKEVVNKAIIVPHAEFERDPATGARLSDIPSRAWDEVVKQQITIEKPCFLSEKQRAALAEASRQLGFQLLIGQKQHVETQIFDTQRAALEEQVKIFFFKKIGMNNAQFQEFFTAADIKRITPEKPINNELGELRNRLAHAERLIGKCETKEKLEKALNETFILEEILDKKTVDTVLENLGIVMEKVKDANGTDESDDDFFERKYLEVARLLIARDLAISKVKRMDRNGEVVEVRQYSLVGWLNAAERDVMTDVYQDEEHKKEGENGKGERAVSYEKKKGVRGLLTNDGNAFTRGQIDLQYAMANRLSFIFGDKKGYATRDADRFMWTRGEKDEMGAEIYAFKYVKNKDGKLIPELDSDGNMVPNLPTGEELLDLWNRCGSETEWKKEIKRLKYLDRFSLPGEPVGSDLSKLIWAYLYALKDQLNERPTGLLLGVDKMPRMSQSLLSLARSSTETGFIKDGKVIKSESLRSAREQWDGYKGSDILVIEPAKSLGEFNWSQTKTIEDLEKEAAKQLGEEIKEVFADSNKEEKDKISNALFTIMNIDEGEKAELIKSAGSTEKALAIVVGKYFDANQNGIASSVDEFYKLFNYLAGDDNPVKRPHAYFMSAKIDPKALLDLDSWTGKKKFLQIIFTAAGAFGDFRKYDIRACRDGKDLSSPKTQKDYMKADSEVNITKVQEGWLQTVMSHPDFPEWEMNSSKYVTEFGGTPSHDFRFKERVLELALKFGFVKKDSRGNFITNTGDNRWKRMKIFPS